MEKKTWQKPELISLTRCKPQEAVLETCKFGSIPGDPVTFCIGCMQTACINCSSIHPS